jgi:tetratricopeptide (TPR) repeat protein
MADRPMHTVPGLFARLQQLYADGEAAIAEDRLDDAEAIFSEGLALDDHFRQRYVTMYAQRGFVRQRKGDAAGALEDYARAIEMEPEINQAQYWFHSGMCHAALGQLDLAVEAYARSIALYDQHPGPFHLRGKLLTSALGRHEEAIADFDRFLEIQEHPEVLQLRGWAKLNLGRAVEAIPDLQRSKSLAASPYTDYLLAWAGAVAPDDELFYQSMEATLAAEPSYRQYFVDNDDYARFRGEARFLKLVGA